MKIAVLVSEFNAPICNRLLAGVLAAFKKEKLSPRNWTLFRVPGAFEIPFMAEKLAKTKKYTGIIALGCVLKGETDHYAAVCAGVTYGIQKVSIENKIPVMFGVLMCKKEKQALARSGNNKKNKGYECAEGLIKLLRVL